MKIVLSLFIICLAFANPLIAQKSAPSVPNQIKKGKWLISHDVFRMGYQTQKVDNYSNDVYSGKDKYSGFHTSLLFQGPYWGGVYASSDKQDNYDANGAETGGYKRNNFSIAIQPSVGRFITDRLLVGAELNLQFSKDNTDYFSPNDSEENTMRSITLGIGPHIRYYFGQLKGKQLFHAGLSGGISYYSMKQESSDNGGTPTVYKTKQPNYYAEPYLGSSWFIGKHWTFGASLSYRWQSSRYEFTSNNNDKTRRNSTYGDIGLDGTIGFSF